MLWNSLESPGAKACRPRCDTLGGMAYWLLKSEPDVFGIHHLKKQKTAVWDGVRNYQARNFLRSVEVGDRAFFYHSSTREVGIVGLCKVIETGIADPSQFDPKSEYHDPKSSPVNPRWWTVRVEFEQAFGRTISLDELRQHFSPDELWVVRKGNRLSVTPVSDAAAKKILSLAKAK